VIALHALKAPIASLARAELVYDNSACFRRIRAPFHAAQALQRGPLKTRKRKTAIVPRFAYDGLDRVIHERARLSVMTSLVTHAGALTFGELKELCALTDGNLNRHLLVLEEAGLVSVTKKFEATRQVTRCRLTAAGRRRYLEYLAVLEQVILDGASASRPAADGEPTSR
jgi:DNA-binding MarR family transcriptional regulator